MTKINMTDISTIVQIIDACSARGAFKGDELADVGALRNKMIVMAQEMKEDQIEKPEVKETSYQEGTR